MNAWASTNTGWNGDTNDSLRRGLYGYQFACAAELMRDYSGWDSSDFTVFQDYMYNLFYLGNNSYLVNHHGTCDTHYWANWEHANMASVLAIGVLLDDQAIFDEAIDYFYNGVGNGNIYDAVWHIHPSGLGQWQESGRDQGHSLMGPQLLGAFVEIAWNQGYDLYGYDNNRFLATVEYISEYNTWNDVPYVTHINCEYWINPTISSDGRGSIRPGWDLVYNHYVNRLGKAAPYTQEYAELARPEGGGFNYGTTSGGFDGLGFTTLTHSRDPIASGAVPSDLLPYIKGRRITLSWAGSAYAESYNVKRSTTIGGPYTTIATVGTENLLYVDPGLTAGTTYYYVVSANNPGGESTNSTEVAATADGQLHGTVIGTDGSWNDAGAEKYCAFDGSLKNFFDPPVGDAWAGLDLGSGVSAVIKEVKYCPSNGFAYRMVGGKFQGSDTANFSSGVVDLFTITSEPVEGVLTSQSISNGIAFRYVRYLAPESKWGNVAEAQFLGDITGFITPPAPTGLTATPSYQYQIDLTWDAVSGADSYNVKRATTSGGPNIIAANGTGTSYRDSGLDASTTYYYVVTALNSAGESANSNEASAMSLENVALGCTASANDDNSEWSPNEVSDSAFDGDVYTKWYTGDGYTTDWLQADLGVDNEAVVVRYNLTSANDESGRDPKDWQLLASNDGNNWTTLDTRSG
jgi:fibronectin type 3 domain-containing protein